VKIIEKDYLISLTKGDVERAMMEVKREIEVLKHIPPHKNVVNFIEHFETSNHFLLIFEEVQCGDLCEIILRAPEAKLEETRAKRYTRQLVQAVLHCHVHEVIHRDIKPENLLVTPTDDLKLTDFGLAKWSIGATASAQASTHQPGSPASRSSSVGTSHSTSLGLVPPNYFNATLSSKWLISFPGAERLTGKRIVCSDVIGTPRYGAPEMFHAKLSQTQYDGYKADTWSVGVVVYILLTGTFPFFAGSGTTEQETFKAISETPLNVPAHVSAQAKDFLHRILAKDPMKRLSLHEALDHPWLDIEPFDSAHRCETAFLAASALEQRPVDASEVLRCCEQEVHALHATIAKLRRELLTARWREQALLAAPSAASGRPGAAGSLGIRRPETPPPGGRAPRSSSSAAAIPAARQISPSNGPLMNRGIGAPRGASANSPIRSASRPEGVSRGGSTTASGVAPRSVASARTASPLVRSNPSTQRRGTPLRSSTGNVVASAGTTKRSTTPSSLSGPRPTTGSLGAGRTSSSILFDIGDHVVYKNFKAVVQFSGTTGFGPGTWIGLEMLEGSEGTNDGTSFVDKKRYFTCPKGKGIFVRASQIKKAEVPTTET